MEFFRSFLYNLIFVLDFFVLLFDFIWFSLVWFGDRMCILYNLWMLHNTASSLFMMMQNGKMKNVSNARVISYVCIFPSKMENNTKQPLGRDWPKSLTPLFFLQHEHIMLPLCYWTTTFGEKPFALRCEAYCHPLHAWIGFHRSNKGIISFFSFSYLLRFWCSISCYHEIYWIKSSFSWPFQTMRSFVFSDIPINKISMKWKSTKKTRTMLFSCRLFIEKTVNGMFLMVSLWLKSFIESLRLENTMQII